MSRVFVAGALHLDILLRAPHLPQLDETVTGTSVAYTMGGKGGNQALAAARHGAPVSMAGRVGTDGFADQILEALVGAGVDTTQIQRGPGASGMSAAIVQDDGSYGAVIVSAANLDIDPTQITVPPDTSVVLLQNEVPTALNLAVAQAAKARGAQVILNAAPARAPDPTLMPLVDLLVVNRVEGSALSGLTITDQVTAQRAAEHLSQTTETILTLGADGLIHAKGTQTVHHTAPRVKTLSTHGAGDAFLGAYAARCAAGEPVGALAYAQAVAALHVSRPDHQTITPAQVQALL